MLRETSPILGVDVSADGIRIVELKQTVEGNSLSAHIAVPLPENAVIGGRIQHPELVGKAIDDAVNSMGTRTRDAVFTIDPACISARTLTVPPANDDELRIIVAGEVYYHQLLRENEGAFEYLPVDVKSPQGDTQVLVMALEHAPLDALAETARHAKIKLAAREPAQIGLLRAALQETNGTGAMISLIVTAQRSDIVVTDNGQIRMYRSLDFGGSSLTSASGEEGFSKTGATGVATELARSVDYYERENPGESKIGTVVFATNLGSLHSFGEWLQQNLDRPVRVVAPGADGSQPGSRETLQFAAAYGAALGFNARWANVLRSMDISEREYVPAEVKSARKGLVASLLASIVIIGGAVYAGYYYGNKANEVEASVDKLQQELTQLESVERTQATLRLEQLTELRTLAASGVLLPQLMDSVTSALDPGVGITLVEVDETWRVKISGEAASEGAMISTLERLRQYPEFNDTSVVSFQALGSETQRDAGLRFEISSQYTGVGAEERRVQ